MPLTRRWPPVPQVMPDPYLSQPNPVDNQLYTVLPPTKNVVIYGIAGGAVWTTGAPNLTIYVTVDGILYDFHQNSVTSATFYHALLDNSTAESSQFLEIPSNYNDFARHKPFLLQGRTVKVETKVSAGVGVTSLVCRVKYGKF